MQVLPIYAMNRQEEECTYQVYVQSQGMSVLVTAIYTCVFMQISHKFYIFITLELITKNHSNFC